jgi:hypothetical protein
MQYCMLRVCICKTNTSIVFTACENPWMRVFSQFRLLTRSCMQCMHYCMMRAGNCKIKTAILFPMCENLRLRVFIQFRHLTRSCMQCMHYCTLHAGDCKSGTAIVFGMSINPRIRKISSFCAKKPTWPRGAREVREIFIPRPISPRRLGRPPINDIPFDSSRRALQLFKRKLSDPISKFITYRPGT